MFQILYKADGVNFSYQCSNEEQKNNFIQILTNSGIEYSISESPAEMYYQICGCIFQADGKLYTYVRPEGDAKPGMSGSVEVVDSFGNVSVKEVVILDTRKASVSEIRSIAKNLGRDKLGKIDRVWQRKIA